MKRFVSFFPWQHYLPRFFGYDLSLSRKISGFGTPLRCAANIKRFFDFSVLNNFKRIGVILAPKTAVIEEKRTSPGH